MLYNGAPSIEDTNEYLVKIDYNLGKHHLSGHYFQLQYKVPIILPPASNILEGTFRNSAKPGFKEH